MLFHATYELIVDFFFFFKKKTLLESTFKGIRCLKKQILLKNI